MTLQEFKKLPIGTKVLYAGECIGTKISNRKIEFQHEDYIIENEDSLEEIYHTVYDNILDDYMYEDFVTIEKLKQVKCDYYTLQVLEEDESRTWFSSADIMKCVEFYKNSPYLQDKSVIWQIMPQKFNTNFKYFDFATLEDYE